MRGARDSRAVARMLAFLALGILISVSLSAPDRALSTSAWKGDFETGSLDQWTRITAPDGAVKVVSSPTAAGEFAGRFVVTPDLCRWQDTVERDPTISDGECARHHSYVVKRTDETPGTESWWSWSILWPAGFQADTSVFNNYGEWHGRTEGLSGCNPNVSLSIVRKSSGPEYPLSVTVRGGECGSGPSRSALVGTITPGKWMTFVWHMKWSQGSDGLAEIWVNGAKQASLTGPNVFSNLPSREYDVYLQQGLYTGAGSVTQTIYVDEVTRGDSYEDVAGAPRTPDPEQEEPEPAPEPPDEPGDPAESEPPTSTAPEPTETTPPPSPSPSEPPPSPGQGNGSHHGLRSRGQDAPDIGSFTYVSDKACLGCLVARSHGKLWATVTGAGDHRDTAYGLHRLAVGSSDRVWLRTIASLPGSSPLDGNVVLAQVRDRDNALVYNVVAGPSRTIAVVSPAGGLDADKLRLDTGVPLGGGARRIEVSAKANSSLAVRVDGRLTNLRDGFSGARTEGQRFVRVGIVNYTGNSDRTVTAAQHGIGISTAGWLGERLQGLALPWRPRSLSARRLHLALEGIPTSRVHINVRAGGRRVGHARARLGGAGLGDAVVHLKRWQGQRRLLIRLRSAYSGPGVAMIRRDSERLVLRAPERRRLSRH